MHAAAARHRSSQGGLSRRRYLANMRLFGVSGSLYVAARCAAALEPVGIRRWLRQFLAADEIDARHVPLLVVSDRDLHVAAVQHHLGRVANDLPRAEGEEVG